MKVGVANTYQDNQRSAGTGYEYFQFSNNIMLFKTVVLLSYQRIRPFLSFKIILHTLLCGL